MHERNDALNVEKKILITGAAGFIGFHFAQLLLNRGLKVIGYDNLNDYYDVNLKYARLAILNKFKDFTFVQGDLSDYIAVGKLFEEFKPDIVVNLAAQAGVRYSLVNPFAYIQSNIVGFHNLLEMCRLHQTEHLIYASSSSVYGANRSIPFSVQDKTDSPVSLYAATKKSNELMAYSYCHLFGLKATGLRFFTVYGPYGRPDMAYFSFTDSIIRGEPIKVYNNGDMYRDFTYIDDIVKCMEKMLFQPPLPDETGVRHKVYNIGNHKPEKLLDLISILESCLGKEAKKTYYPMQPGDVYQTYADVSDLIRDFNFQPNTPLSYGLKMFTEWYIKYYNTT